MIVKELQSLVDYSRSPDTTHSSAVDPLFTCSVIANEARQTDYPFYWSATTHAGFRGGGAAMYVAFGRAAGWMSPRRPAGGPPDGSGGFGPGFGPGFGGPPPFGPDRPPEFGPAGPGGSGPGGVPEPGREAGAAGEYHYVDVHGAGAQRSDPKAGNPAMFPHGRGPQGDVIRIFNHVRLVRSELE